MNELARIEYPKHIVPVDTGRECAGHFWMAQRPVKQNGYYVQHWKALSCSRTVFKVATGWFVFGESHVERIIYATQEEAMEAAAKHHENDLRKAIKFVSRFAKKDDIRHLKGGGHG